MGNLSSWLDKAADVAFGEDRADLAKVTAGGVLLMLGGKATPLYLVHSGLRGLEEDWRARHAFDGTLAERWAHATQFYESTHRDDTNRILHMIGIPMIVGGTAGLLVFPSYTPPWGLSWGAFTLGWALNLVGHKYFERNAPAFEDDPLSFLAGPVWDVKHIRRAVASKLQIRLPMFSKKFEAGR